MDKLHAAVCQAVAILNTSPEIARIAAGRDVREILRHALVEYADNFMDQPVTDHERESIARKHRKLRAARGAGEEG